MKYFSKNLLYLIFLCLLLVNKITSLETKNTLLNDFKKISYYTVNLKTVCVCNNFLFYNESNAKEYQQCLLKKTIETKDSCQPNERSKGKKIDDFKYKYLIGEYDGKYLTEINPFSEKYRKHVWGDCSPNCFKKLNKSDLEYRILKELNSYRKLHGADKLSLDKKYSKLAKKISYEYFEKNNYDICHNTTAYGCIQLFSETDQAHLGVTKLYNNLLWYYNWKENSFKHFLLHPIQLIWKKARNIGIHISELNSVTCIFLTFSSKVKNDKNYKKNVSPVLKKYILEYGSFKE
ncbi:CAP domain-containing protein [Strongyloides ratti]|uniref:CAP domain-containing protein n=1 Tax=Strongyloides ratti TaxID=34506 RepID=A0A090L618_STRRB|nr:CAP domain-containing protein [Strongyloides ratti]CEF63573.1 CAP domain-containing protein [Strongyloides ratti]